FAAVILINSLATTVMHRQREFAQLRLAGATPAQVRAVVWVEGITTSACGLLLGTVAALVGIIPYTSGQTSQLIPSGLGWIGGAIAIGVVAIVVLTTRAAVGRALRTPMLHPAA
ncbi:MAG TPA: FtsX-like permease family protein, partial [Nocardioidaceae bacterium]|nr:FtsX-like permease family protein [Nocardioidaceae bacterium]